MNVDETDNSNEKDQETFLNLRCNQLMKFSIFRKIVNATGYQVRSSEKNRMTSAKKEFCHLHAYVSSE